MVKRDEEETGETVMEDGTVPIRFFLLLIGGVVLIFVGVAVIVVASMFYDTVSASAGVVIFIGPFPIVIGAVLSLG